MTDEKYREKETEKHEEKSHRDPLGTVIAAAILIWVGVLLLADNLGFLDVFTGVLASLSIRPYDLSWELPFISWETVQVFFLGMGVIVVIEIIIRLLVPQYRRRLMGSLVAAVAFFALGLGSWSIIGPAIVIAVGLSILIGGLLRRPR